VAPAPTFNIVEFLVIPLFSINCREGIGFSSNQPSLSIDVFS